MVETCNHTSVGIIVKRGSRLLLIERKKFPFGFAPPAGHVDDGESYEEAGRRELEEEVGLRSSRLFEVSGITGRRSNKCRRPDGDWHEWRVFKTDDNEIGSIDGHPDEVKQVRWVSPFELRRLIARTKDYLDGDIPEDEWVAAPGLEPVWMEMLQEAGYV